MKEFGYFLQFIGLIMVLFAFWDFRKRKREYEDVAMHWSYYEHLHPKNKALTEEYRKNQNTCLSTMMVFLLVGIVGSLLSDH